MFRQVEGFSPDVAKSRIGSLIEQTQEETGKLGIQTLIVGSIGIAGLTGICPILFRGFDRQKNSFKCVDIDVLIGLPVGINLYDVKRCFDNLWLIGMNSQYRIPVSPVNLPKEVANDPRQVLGLEWILGQQVRYIKTDGSVRILPEWFTDPVPTEIYGQKFETLSPEAQVVFKLTPGWRNPLRVIKDLRQILILTEAYPQAINGNRFENSAIFDFCAPIVMRSKIALH